MVADCGPCSDRTIIWLPNVSNSLALLYLTPYSVFPKINDLFVIKNRF